MCSSLSKNFGLYSERVGALHVVTRSPERAEIAASQIKRLIRANYSNPPAHGAALVAGVLGAAVLGLGRALGETMAVAMVSGSVLGASPRSIYDTFTTIAATIVSQLDSSLSDGSGFATRTMAELALVLLAITLVVNVIARLIIRSVSTTALPVGRGV